MNEPIFNEGQVVKAMGWLGVVRWIHNHPDGERHGELAYGWGDYVGKPHPYYLVESIEGRWIFHGNEDARANMELVDIRISLDEILVVQKAYKFFSALHRARKEKQNASSK